MYPTLWCPKRAICEILKHESSQKCHQLLRSALTWKARCTAGRALKQTRHYLPHTAVLSGHSLKVSPWLHLHLNSVTRQTDSTAAWLHGNSYNPESWEIIHASFSSLQWWQEGRLLEKEKMSHSCPSVAPFTRSYQESISMQLYL